MSIRNLKYFLITQFKIALIDKDMSMSQRVKMITKV